MKNVPFLDGKKAVKYGFFSLTQTLSGREKFVVYVKKFLWRLGHQPWLAAFAAKGEYRYGGYRKVSVTTQAVLVIVPLD